MPEQDRPSEGEQGQPSARTEAAVVMRPRRLEAQQPVLVRQEEDRHRLEGRPDPFPFHPFPASDQPYRPTHWEARPFWI